MRKSSVFLISLTILFLTTACGISKPAINTPKLSDIKIVKIAGGVPGSPSIVLTKAQYSPLLDMLQKAKETGYHTHPSAGHPFDVFMKLTNGRTIMIVPASDWKQESISKVGVEVKNYVDVYDSADKSNKPLRLYSPALYNFLTNWQREIPKSQWKKDY